MSLKLLLFTVLSLCFISCHNNTISSNNESKDSLNLLFFQKEKLNTEEYQKKLNTLLLQYKGNQNPVINAKLYYHQAKYNYAKGVDSVTEMHLRKSIPILSKHESDCYLMLIDGLNIQGTIEFNSGNYNTSKQYYKQAIYYSEKYFNQDSLTPKFALKAFEGYGCVNRVLNKFELAEVYLEKTIVLAKKLQDTDRLISAYSNLSLVYTDTGKLDKALSFIRKAEELAMISSKENLPMVYNYYTSVYYEKKDWNKALFYFEKEFEADPELNSVDKALNLSLIYLELQKIDLANPYIEFLEKEYLANRLSEYNRIQTLERLVRFYTEIKDFKKVAFYFNLYGKELDEVTKSEQLATTEDFIKKYDLKAKEDQIEKLNQKNKTAETKINQQKFRNSIILLLFLLVIAFSILLYFQQRNKKLKAEKQLLIMEDTLLRSQMEPHFVFNALSSLQSLIYENKNQLAVKYLSKFAQLLRLSLEHSRMKFVPFKREIESIENYLELQKMRFSATFKYQIVGNLKNVEKYEIPPLMIQPFVENAIYHGFNGIDYEGQLKITFEKHPDYICFTIEDNGVGLEKSKNNSNKTKTSLSTTMTVERLHTLYETKNKINFLEIKNNHGQKSGTAVILRLPFIKTL